MKNLLRKSVVLILVISMLSLCGCDDKNPNEGLAYPKVTMVVEGFGTVVIELYQDYAPNTVANFVNLVQSGFYDGLTFHRIIEGFMIQGGDPEGTGSGGPGYSIKGEFKANGYEKNTLKHTSGMISMARTNQYDSAGSQFFICTGTTESLDGKYAAFGKVTEGMEVIYAISRVETYGESANYKPVETVTIKSMTVEITEGDYSKVDKIK